MNISDVPLPVPYLERLGITKLNPPQEAAIQSGLLDGKNLVVASQTASGKTAIAEMAIIKHLTRGGKCVYTVPLRALASEKFDEFKKKYENLGMRIVASTGDLDSSEEWLGKYDVIIATNEKLDSLVRHNANWIGAVTLVIADEIHLIADPHRGPTLEIVLTRLRQIASPQILALSATIANADEVAEWLDAKAVKSDWRPVKLYRGVLHPEELTDSGYLFDLNMDGRKYKLKGVEAEHALLRDTFERNKQVMIFFSTRRNAESGSEKAAKAAVGFLSADERTKLSKLSREIEGALAMPTRQCKRLAQAVRMGAAFHHAGLVASQRKAVEEAFKAGLIKALTATTSLAYGVNLPAWRVLIRDAKRYSGVEGSAYIPVFEVMQMYGRAGRPKYDTEGEAILFARSKDEADELKERYIDAGPEPIDSKLAAEPVLRMHVLALIATETARSKKQMLDFFSKTFFGHQFSDMLLIEEKLEKIINELEGWHFVEREGENFIGKGFVPAFALSNDVKLRATQLGRRVSELYIDPLSASKLIHNLRKQSDIAHLVSISTCGELWPPMRLRKDEWEEYAEMLAAEKIKDVPRVHDIDYGDYVAAFKTAKMFETWMNEASEENVLEYFGLPPGELYNKVTSANWMLYAARELAMTLLKRDVANDLNRMILQMRYGVKEELLPLVMIKGVGRVRARVLWNAGLRGIESVRRAPLAQLERMLGPKLAKTIKEAKLKDIREKV